MLSKMLKMAALFDVYGPLLTERQQEICCLYYLNDYSLSEISELHGVSRQAIHDTLVRAEQGMSEYENRFGLVRSNQAKRRQLEELASALAAARESLDMAVHALEGESQSGQGSDLDAARMWLAKAVSAVQGCEKAAASMEECTGLCGDHGIDEREGGL